MTVSYEERRSKFRLWTAKEERFLKKNWNKLSREEIAQALERTVSSVASKASRMGIRKTDQETGLFKSFLRWFNFLV